ncbi:MAG: hypothetical protein KDC87_07580 [Planctomycetes bacterium]|nr:hypothetical protein [Planctomycetota bacterium]MCB9888627.1 hypothetical protein [Planctomycetota bacterium]
MGISAEALSALPATVVAEPAPATRGEDRRRRPTPALSRYAVWGGGRRRHHRRGREALNGFVDAHGPGLFLVVTAVAALNILDAFFTVLFLSYGGREINPVVQTALDLGTWWFVVLKSVGIGLCLAFLTVTKNFRVARIGLWVILAGYLLLLGWHGLLYTRLPEFG